MTDSQFMIDSITKWIKKWKRNGWKVASGEPVKNQDDFIKLDQVMQDVDVRWVNYTYFKK